MTRYLTRDRWAIAAAVVVPLAAAAILIPWRGSWPNTNVALLLVVAVVAVAALGNRIAGALAAVSASAWFDFFFTQPYERFTMSHSSDVTTFALLLAVGIAVSQLAAHARHLKAVTVADAGYLARIVDSAALTQSAGSPDAVVQYVRRQLTDLLDLADCRFEYGTLIGQPPRLEPDGSVLTRHGHWPVDVVGLPAEEIELRTFSNGQYCGRFMMAPNAGSSPPRRARLVAVTLADLAGHALGAAAGVLAALAAGIVTIAAAELLDPAGRVDHARLAGVERVARGRDLHVDDRVGVAVFPLDRAVALQRGLREEREVRRAVPEDDGVIVGMNVRLHDQPPC
jgi:hypothetical protein